MKWLGKVLGAWVKFLNFFSNFCETIFSFSFFFSFLFFQSFENFKIICHETNLPKVWDFMSQLGLLHRLQLMALAENDYD
jgi:hypothetical protein